MKRYHGSYGKMGYGNAYKGGYDQGSPRPYGQQMPSTTAGYASQYTDTAKEAASTSVGQNIVDVAAAAGNFSTLISAVEAAGLADTLSGEGPFTVLAPSDAAFSALPKDQVADLMGDTDALRDVLTYHVIVGELSAADLLEKGEATTVNGAKVTVGQLDVAKADIAASNGVIHVINSVLIPTE